MTRSSRANRCRGQPVAGGRTGFTLVELLVAGVIMGLILSSLCGIYFTTALDWEYQSGENEALAAASGACRRIADYVSQATGALVITRFSSSDTLFVNLPLDTAYGGTYIPVWGSGRISYRPGTWVAFYLSDSSGSSFVTGNILWAGTVTWAAGSYTITPDRNWSVYYDTSRGKIAPVKSLRFALDETGARPTVTVTAVSAYKIKQIEKQVSLSRTICLRNTN